MDRQHNSETTPAFDGLEIPFAPKRHPRMEAVIPVDDGPSSPDLGQQLARATLRSSHSSRLRRHMDSYRNSTCRSPTQFHGDSIDIDLLAAGYIAFTKQAYLQPKTEDAPLFVVATPQGALWLAERSKAARVAKLPHENLIAAMVDHLVKRDRMVYTDIEFLDREHERKPGEQSGKALCRPDVFSFNSALDIKSFDCTVHEVKVSRSDFLSDLRQPEKCAAYSRIAERVYYVIPEGMATRNDMPTGIGLITVNQKGEFKTVVRAARNKPTLRHRDYLNLILKPPTARPSVLGAP